MAFELIRERKLVREQVDGYRRASGLFVQDRREAIRILTGCGMLFFLPRLVGTAHAAVPAWTVVVVNMAKKSLNKGNKIPADVTLANAGNKSQQARVELEYMLPSGLSGQQATRTVRVPPETEQTFRHSDFTARELGDSTYEAKATGDGDGDDSDEFVVT